MIPHSLGRTPTYFIPTYIQQGGQQCRCHVLSSHYQPTIVPYPSATRIFEDAMHRGTQSSAPRPHAYYNLSAGAQQYSTRAGVRQGMHGTVLYHACICLLEWCHEPSTMLHRAGAAHQHSPTSLRDRFSHYCTVLTDDQPPGTSLTPGSF
jgi:hypothetical protein